MFYYFLAKTYISWSVLFYEQFDIVKTIYGLRQKVISTYFLILLAGPEDELLTKNTQPAILTVSYSIFKVLEEKFNFDFKSFKFFAGHSLGEYCALVCSGSLNFLDALYLLHERGKAMQEAVPVGKGKMLAVLGIKYEELDELIKNSKIHNGVCEVANDNAEGQIIISGDKEALDKFQIILKEKKIKSIPLKVSAPFHCSLMKNAAKVMSNKINQIDFKTPYLKIVNNVTAEPVSELDKIKKTFN